MTFQVTFNVYGDVVPKARPRFTRSGHAYTPKRTSDYESEVAAMAKRAMGGSPALETPVDAFIYVTMAIPPSWSKKRQEAALGQPHTQRPDLDNQVKAITDAINGIIYKDDSQICSLHCKKVWGTTGMVQVLVREHLP